MGTPGADVYSHSGARPRARHRRFQARNWSRARDLLRDALSAGTSDEALEMLAVSSWWLDDGPTARLARERQFRSLRRAGDDAGAARVAIALAWDATIFASDTAVARGWAARARSLLGATPPSEDHAWLELREATLDGADSAAYAETRLSRTRPGRVRRRDDRGGPRGGREGRRRRDRGWSRLHGRGACSGLRRRARSTRVAITFACCQLFAACGRVRDYDHAFQWCQRVADLCERRNIWSVLSATRCSYAAVLMRVGAMPKPSACWSRPSRATARRACRTIVPARSHGWAICVSDKAGSTRRIG